MIERGPETFSQNVGPRLEANLFYIGEVHNFRNPSHIAGQQWYARAHAFQHRVGIIIGEGGNHRQPSRSSKVLDCGTLIFVRMDAPRNGPRLGSVTDVADT